MSMPGANSKPASAASSFCAHFTASKVSSVVGLKVTLLEAIPEKKTLECIYLSTSAVQVIISREPGIPASELATRAKAEARVKAESPKGTQTVKGINGWEGEISGSPAPGGRASWVSARW